ncbi:hypothetical protein GQ55_6G263100 [Panicum hallii var. hallii]|uniref:Uncharacterized protein n=1 Tax=Panicum hallii var. hallii TaxID=1504633 RepID=A0A2T7D9S2_9POAL|nr:hypothetical protein GQ55_6G263100 [Panicum hallii var. hallii]
MAAAAGGHRRHSKGKKRLLFVEEKRMLDGSCDAYLVFKINLKDMFASAAGAEGGEEDWAMPMRNFPRPVAQFDTLPGRPERLDLAVVSGSGGTNIVAVSSDKEGDWELPFARRGLFVPDLGLCFGICPRRLGLCAFDVPTSGAGEPPAVRYVWQMVPSQSAETGDSTCKAPAAWPTWETANSASPGPSASSTPANGLPSF